MTTVWQYCDRCRLICCEAIHSVLVTCVSVCSDLHENTDDHLSHYENDCGENPFRIACQTEIRRVWVFGVVRSSPLVVINGRNETCVIFWRTSTWNVRLTTSTKPPPGIPYQSPGGTNIVPFLTSPVLSPVSHFLSPRAGSVMSKGAEIRDERACFSIFQRILVDRWHFLSLHLFRVVLGSQRSFCFPHLLHRPRSRALFRAAA